MKRFGPILAAAMAFAMSPASAESPQVRAWQIEWPQTDFSRSLIDFSEVLEGGPPKDGIPAIWEPDFRPVAGEDRIDPREPVLTLEPATGPARAYPVRYLMWHEIVNDIVDGRPVAVTYCPLCNSAMVFDATVGGEPRSFGVSGKLRHSDMIMYDRETESWWQQATGQGIVGVHAGEMLEAIPAWMESWDDFVARNPEGLVMEQPRYMRDYGRNPYVGYDGAIRPFLYRGETPPHGIPPLARMVRVGERAWPFARVREAGELAEAGVVITWTEGQASALDTAVIGQGREVGTIRVRDTEGRDVAHDIPFAFAFHAFFPQGEWMLGE